MEVPLLIDISDFSLRQLESWCDDKYKVEINSINKKVYGSFTKI